MAERKLSTLQKAYADFFFQMLDEFKVKTPAKLSDEKKKEFFNKIKTDWPKVKRSVKQEGILSKEDKLREMISEAILDELVNRELLMTLAKDRAFNDIITSLVTWFSSLTKNKMDKEEKVELRTIVLDYMQRTLRKL